MSLLKTLSKTVPSNATDCRKLIACLSIFLSSYFFAAPLLARPLEIQGFLQTYCNECHGADKQKGDRRFDELKLPAVKVDTLIELKDILDQLNLGDMPPKKAKQPSSEERKIFIEQATQALTDGREKLASTGGSTVLRRLNRREYLNTIGDLFDLNMAAFDPTNQFPRDQSEENMENLGDVLQTSGYLLDQNLDAASVIVEKVFALQQPPPEQTWHFNGNFQSKGKQSNPQREYDNRYLNIYECTDSEKHVGGYAFIHDFKDGVPTDGLYDIKVLAHAMHRENPYDPKIFGIDPREPYRLGVVPGDDKAGPLEHPQPLQPMLAEFPMGDGKPEWHAMKVWLDAGHTPRFVFPNGPRDARGSWQKIAEYHKNKWPPTKKNDRIPITDAHRIAVVDGKMPHIRIHEVVIRGPLTDGTAAIPQQVALAEASLDPKKAREVLEAFASRAYRRPITQDELERHMDVALQRVRTGHTPQVAFKDAVKSILCSPAFLYHSQNVLTDDLDPSKPPKLDGYALATRLSYFLWSTMPDEELIRLASDQQLTKTEVLLAQTRRMLASPRSDAFVSSFLDSWLNLRNLGGMPPDRKEFENYFYKGLEPAFKRETQLFMRDLIERDASIVHFLDSDYSFVNQPLATHYGLGELGEPARAHDFRKVSFKDAKRGGLLGMGSVLTITANGIETSPVVRGVYLLENILGTPPPPPPDDVPAIDPDVRGAKSMRELLSKHRESASCMGCHQKIDPLGFALENFDPIGGWRDRIEKTNVDASGELPSGEKFSDIVGLKRILVQRQDMFARMLTDRLLTYACGRRIGALEEPIVESIVAELPQYEYGLRSLIEMVVTSELFRNR
jgi:Protein of unknown function (DUF1592)/Protein of unknown function (DUF1588)/Protein of unknown function (DUF1585)/Protein of unknown function (DUF1595)/Protein of unknown function (DUF1587)/Planctomycete cytochrome C